MAARKPIPKDIGKCLLSPYDSWKNRIATYRFVKDIPVRPSDASFQTVSTVSENLYKLGHLPVLICWGLHDFVFDLDYFNEWRQRFPDAEAHLLEDAGHYILEDAPEKVAGYMAAFFERTTSV
jgi:haloalkane dehalogenase